MARERTHRLMRKYTQYQCVMDKINCKVSYFLSNNSKKLQKVLKSTNIQAKMTKLQAYSRIGQ